MIQSSTARKKVRVLIIEKHLLFAESLEISMKMEGYDAVQVPVPDDANPLASLVAAAARLRPQVVLLDLDLGSFGDGVRLIAPLTEAGAAVVVMTASNDKGRWGECLRYGARKVLTKSQPLNEILATVRRISQGQRVLEDQERTDLLQQWQKHQVLQAELGAKLAKLTHRERQVLGHLTRGRTVRDIAALSHVSEATVRTQVKSILAKLEVSSQLAAVGAAHHVRWRSPVD